MRRSLQHRRKVVHAGQSEVSGVCLVVSTVNQSPSNSNRIIPNTTRIYSFCLSVSSLLVYSLRVIGIPSDEAIAGVVLWFRHCLARTWAMQTKKVRRNKIGELALLCSIDNCSGDLFDASRSGRSRIRSTRDQVQ